MALTAGFARLFVRGNRRVPAPPPRIIESTVLGSTRGFSSTSTCSANTHTNCDIDHTTQIQLWCHKEILYQVIVIDFHAIRHPSSFISLNWTVHSLAVCRHTICSLPKNLTHPELRFQERDHHRSHSFHNPRNILLLGLHKKVSFSPKYSKRERMES